MDNFVQDDDVDGGNPEKLGASAVAGLSTITPVTAPNRTFLYAGTDGALIMRDACLLGDIFSGVNGAYNTTANISMFPNTAPALGRYMCLASLIAVNDTTTDTRLKVVNNLSQTVILVNVPKNGGVIVDLPAAFVNGENANWYFNTVPAVGNASQQKGVTVTSIGYWLKK